MAKVFTPEDADLTSSIRVVKERVYSDLDLTFGARTPEWGYDSAAGGDILKKTDAAAVKQSIKNLILTNNFEKPYRPQFGANLSSMLFELADADTGDEILSMIKRSIERYEPRAKVLNIDVYAGLSTNTISVNLEFRVVGTTFYDTLKLKVDEPTPIVKVLPRTPAPVDDNILSVSGYGLTLGDSADDEILLMNESLILLAADLGLSIDALAILSEPDGDILTLQNGLQVLKQNLTD